MKIRTFATGVLTGMIMGAGVSMMMKPMDSRDMRRIKAKAGRMMRTVNNLMDMF